MNVLHSTASALMALTLWLGATVPSAQIGGLPATARSMDVARSPYSIPLVPLKQLPPEAKKTILLIQQGGPFPYRKDGTLFGNRERRLPAAPSGYYREYTVPTPGSVNRGARRIVTGSQQEYYYTKDHYQSFVKVKF